MTPEQYAFLNLLASGGAIAMLVLIERRLTRLETEMRFVLGKVKAPQGQQLHTELPE